MENKLDILGVRTKAHWKTIIGILFRLAVIAIGVFLLFLAGIIIYERWEKHFGYIGRRYINVTNGIVVEYRADNAARIKNLRTRKWTTPWLRWVGNEPPADSISVFCTREGLRGFYNTNTGKITIPGSFRHAWYFSDGVAAVVGEDAKVRFINYDGTEAVPGGYYYSPGSDYVFHNGYCEMYNDSTGKIGLLRKDGIWALDQKYDEIIRYEAAGVTITRLNNEWRLWNEDFTPAIDEVFEAIKMADKHDAVYVVKNHRKQKLSFDGTIIEPFIIDSTYDLRYIVKYHEDEENEFDIIPEVVVYRVEGHEGLMDRRTGTVLTLAVYDDFQVISRTLLKAMSASWETEGVVMNLEGKIQKNICRIARTEE